MMRQKPEIGKDRERLRCKPAKMNVANFRDTPSTSLPRRRQSNNEATIAF